MARSPSYGNNGRPNNSQIARPFSKQNEGKYTTTRRTGYDNLKPHDDWQEGGRVTVRLRKIRPVDLQTYNIMKALSAEGVVGLVKIYEKGGVKDGGAEVMFLSPPHSAFWNNNGKYWFQGSQEAYFVDIERLNERRGKTDQVDSPIRRGVKYDTFIKLVPGRIHFGIMVDQETMMPHAVVKKHSYQRCQDLEFEVDLQRLRINANFDVLFFQEGQSSNRVNRYKLQIPFASLGKIQRIDIQDKNTFALIISLSSPPQFYRKSGDAQAGHSDENLKWTEFDSWYRQTDIVYDGSDLRSKKVSLLKEENPIIDLGRWTTYLFEFSTSKIPQDTYDNMKQALQDFNIEIETIGVLNKEKPRPAILWSLIDHSHSEHSSSNSIFIANNLPWEVRYQLEVCISHGILNEYNLHEEFIRRLAAMCIENPRKARGMLEWAVRNGEDRRFFYKPLQLLNEPKAFAESYEKSLPKYCRYSRKAQITPTSIYFSSPTMEITNRVLRYYARENDEGRFLRVQFTDENGVGRINASAKKKQNDELFSRVFRTLHNGIQIGDRHFEFLAFGNSQFRENGAYFFCPTEYLSCNDIRHWMGNFSSIKVVAKYAARLGQCFSTTRAIDGLSNPELVRIDDVNHGKYCFTDGVGKISQALAQRIATEYDLKATPSAFQFRLGGAKGIVVVWPDVKDREIHLRESQEKFSATYNGLEVIRCSHFSAASLNRQTITILSALGVPDKIFNDMIVEQLANYQIAMTDDTKASGMLLRYIDESSMTINIAAMVRNKFMAQRDPFVLSLLHLWRSWSIKLLKEKAKIMVERGAFVLGCVDETNTLQGHRTPTVAVGEQNLEEELPEIFLQVPTKEDPTKYEVVIGICLVGRNPSLHPGDIRVVRAVDIEALHHLRDVVVFSQKGERDVPSMCSGGDLDGDDYFVIWDENLLPREWNCEAMNYDAPKPKNLHRPVEILDLMKFFVRFMKNDTLPTIAHAHMAQSDYLPNGVKDGRCLELAALHSKAVDYVKSGEPAVMPKSFEPNMWPHFMEKHFKPKHKTYVSKKVLGQLYDKVERVGFTPQYDAPFDERVLRAYDLSDSLMKTARQLKTQYDIAMRRIMAQQEIATEFEIWSTFVLSKPRVGTDYKQQEQIATLADSLKAQFRAICKEKAGGTSFEVLGPFVAAMYKVTQEEMKIALNECKQTRIVGGREVPKRKMEPKYMPLISFPWLFEKEMGRIATGIDLDDDLLNLRVSAPAGKSRKRQGGAGTADLDDFIQQEDGKIIHHGEELELFRHADDSDEDEFREDYDFNQELFTHEDHDYIMGENGETVLETAFPDIKGPIPAHDVSGTGVEEVVPTIPMDGFIDPREAALYGPESETNTSWDKTRESSATDSPFNVEGSRTPVSIASTGQRDQRQSGSRDVSNNVEDATQDFVLLDLRVGTADASEEPPAAMHSNATQMLVDVAQRSIEQDSRQSSSGELTPSSGRNIAESSTNNAVNEIEEELVELDIKESPLEKLERMMGGDDVSNSGTDKAELPEEVEEEVVELEIRESALERLARLMDS